MTVLVASVGLSPVPVALSILSIKPDHVIMVCSAQSLPEADRIKSVVEKKLPGTLFEEYLLLSAEAMANVAIMRREVFDGLTGLLEKIPGFAEDGEYLLAYTGGRSEMVCALVEHHVCHHGHERGDLRFYVDLSNSVLRRDQATALDVARNYRLSWNLTLAERAALNGYVLSGRQRGTGALPSLPSIMAWPAPGDEFTQESRKFAEQFGPFRLPPEKARPMYQGPSAVKDGDGAEACVVHACSSLLEKLRHDGSMAGAGVGEVELWWGCCLFDERRASPICELDVVLRVRNLVLVAEVKKTDQSHDKGEWGFAASVAKIAIRGGEVFGASVEYFFWALLSLPGRPAKYSKRFLDLVQLTGSSLNAEANRHLIRPVRAQERLAEALQALELRLLEVAKEHISSGSQWGTFVGPTAAGRRGIPAGVFRFSPLQGPLPSIITAVGGSRLPVFAVDHLQLDHSPAVARIGPRSAQGHEFHRSLTIDLPLPREADLYDTARLEAFFASMPPKNDGVLAYYATPATKAASAAMTATALKRAENNLPVEMLAFNGSNASMHGASGTIYPLDHAGIDWLDFVDTSLRQISAVAPDAVGPVPYAPLADPAALDPEHLAEDADPLHGQLAQLLHRVRAAGFQTLERGPGYFGSLQAAFPLYIVCGAYHVITIMDPALLGSPDGYYADVEKKRNDTRKYLDAKLQVHQFVTANLFGEAAKPVLFFNPHDHYILHPEKTSTAAAIGLRATAQKDRSGIPHRPLRWTCADLVMPADKLATLLSFLGPVPNERTVAP